jgi:hypothetical protein
VMTRRTMTAAAPARGGGTTASIAVR